MAAGNGPAAASDTSAWHRLAALLARLRRHRLAGVLLADALVVIVCWNATYLFRLGFDRWWSARADYDPLVLAGVVAAYLATGLALGVPRGLWRFSGFGEIKRLALVCAIAGGVSAAVVLALGLVKVPRSVLALHPLLTLMGLALARLVYRALYEHLQDRIAGGSGEIRRALVLGAGEAARLLLAGIHRQGWVVLGLLDDDPAKAGTRVAGVRVLGPVATVQQAAARGGATHLILAMPSASPAQRRAALALAAEAGLPVLTVPGAAELRAGSGLVQRLRAIEPDDLLGREPVVLDEAGVDAVLAGQVVLVTGAGGSIGSELCRQLARRRPARLVLVELSEYNLYALDQELARDFPALPRAALIGDVKDAPQMHALMQHWRPQLVFHAAACKHVPLMEGNAWAALHNNTLGTWRAAQAAAAAGVGRFVLISTDKAVNPTNVMGASKRAAEMVVSALALAHPGTRFMAVRFGNVLGSSGSVIPKFQEQIAAGGPVTVTHPDIVRYFMTIPEAACLVLQAAAVGESGQVLVLDMGEPVRIADLAQQLIRLAGHAPQAIGIQYTGLRPGEKLFEELLAEADTTVPTGVPRLRVARIQPPTQPQTLLDSLQAAAALHDPAAVRAWLRGWVPEYRPAVQRPDAAAPDDPSSAAAGPAARVASAATAPQAATHAVPSDPTPPGAAPSLRGTTRPA
jgi:FlaA1/EpsC-like NDP-sugar epimerase